MDSSRLGRRPQIYDYKPPAVNPKIVGYFSVNQSGELIEGISQLRYMTRNTGSVNVDLSTEEEEDASDIVMSEIYVHEAFFQYLKRHEDTLRFDDPEPNEITFLTGQTTLRAIAYIPFRFFEGSKSNIFGAILLNGIVYLYNTRENYANGWNRKNLFRSYMLSKTAKNVRAERNEETEESGKFFMVLKLRLRSHNIVYSAGSSGVLANKTEEQHDIAQNLDSDAIIKELERRKLVDVLKSEKSASSYKFRRSTLPQIYLKCVFAKCNNVYVGFLTHTNMMYEIKKYSKKSVEDTKHEYWKPNVMLNFTDHFLTFVKKAFEKKMGNEINICNLPEIKLHFKVSSDGITQLVDLPPENHCYTWVPEWYKDFQKERLNI